MNNRRIKLALTVGLMNAQKSNNQLGFIRDLMMDFVEVGSYRGSRMLNNAKVNPSNTKQTYAVQFDNCTVNVDLISNSQTQNQYIQSFQIN